jgi:hypothetical protein
MKRELEVLRENALYFESMTTERNIDQEQAPAMVGNNRQVVAIDYCSLLLCKNCSLFEAL